MAIHGNGGDKGTRNHSRHNCRPQGEPKKPKGLFTPGEKKPQVTGMVDKILDQQEHVPASNGADLMGSVTKKPVRGGIAEGSDTGKKKPPSNPYGFAGAQRSFKLSEAKRREANNDIRETTGRGRNR